MLILRQRMPSLVEKFYTPPKSLPSESLSRAKNIGSADAILTVLNNHRPKRIQGNPFFLIVPSGGHQFSKRMKHWINLFGSLGKVVQVSVVSRPSVTVSDLLMDIRLAVRDKIRELKNNFGDNRSIVLVGFGASSLLAAHSALDNGHPAVAATLCLGFPLTGANGFRGDLDDPLLDTTVPTMFVIGQSSSRCTLDDIEDLRERMTRTLTGLVVVGGANDRLIVSGSKKRSANITQGMVDRCIADEVYDFVSYVTSSTFLATTSAATPLSSSSFPLENRYF